MPERKRCNGADIIGADASASVERGRGTGCARHHQLPSMPVDAELGGDAGDHREQWMLERDMGNEALCRRDPLAQCIRLRFPVGDKSKRVVIERESSADDLHTLLYIVLGLDRGMQAEAVEKLRPELALLRVAAADKRQARRMRIEIPSRSTTFMPLAATSSSRSTR